MSPHDAATACSPEAWSFARMEELWERFVPLTPYGRDARDERLVMADRADIERAHEDTEALVEHLARRAGTPDLDRLSHHLRRLPRLPLFEGISDAPLELVELFQVKKFLANYRRVLDLLDPALIDRFGLRFASTDLAAALDEGGTDPESFFVADAMHPGLRSVRADVAAKAAELRFERAGARERARVELGLDFGAREFLVVPNDVARAVLAARSPAVLVAVEAHDSISCVVRLQDGEAALLLAEQLDALLARERELESEVLARLSRLVEAERERLQRYARAVCALDLARARALLARDLAMTRPRFGSSTLAVRSGRYLPCQWDCSRLGLEYTPLDLELTESAAVLFGSNMGGKTVALQTLVFLQITAQAGLFVPADGFATDVYPWIGYVGDLAGERLPATRGGLSGFGFEMRSFVESWQRAERSGAFLVFDELAHTTSSAEAEAILSSVIEALGTLADSRSLLTTHFRGVQRASGVRYLRMLGLDRARAEHAMGVDEPLAARIRRINGLMRYRIVDEGTDADGGSDAITIAALLGLDERIVSQAERLFRHRADRRAG